MSSDKTAARLKEAADLLGMIEEIMASDLASRSAVSAGMKVTVRTAREAVIRSCVEVRRESIENSPTGGNTLADAEGTRVHPSVADKIEVTRTPADTMNERLSGRRHDLRASIDRMIERNGQ